METTKNFIYNPWCISAFPRGEYIRGLFLQIMNSKINRVYHPWWLWEDYKNGFYNTDSAKNKIKNIERVISFFNDYETTILNMREVSENWYFSMEHNLTNYSMNRIAYIGQSACCFSLGVPSSTTMYAWKFIKYDIRERSDKAALLTIKEWEQKKKYSNTLNRGNQKGIKTESQMKLQLN